jgi:hypothetical protein
MHHDLKAWLETDGDIAAGIDLFERAGGNPFLISHFRSIGNRCRPLLRSQLQQVLDKQPPERVRYKQQFGQEPSEVNKLNARKAELFKEMSYLHTLLGNYQVADTRGAGHEVQVVFHSFRDNSGLTPASAASRILELQAQLSAIWEKLDYYALHGKLPDPPPEPQQAPETAFDLMKRWISLRTYISRSNDSAKVQGWRDELSQIESRLQKTTASVL